MAPPSSHRRARCIDDSGVRGAGATPAGTLGRVAFAFAFALCLCLLSSPLPLRVQAQATCTATSCAWRVDWGACQPLNPLGICGGGQHNGDLKCTDLATGGQRANQDCAFVLPQLPVPKLYRSCDDFECGRWVADSFGRCSPACSVIGNRTRRVWCYSDALQRQVPDSACEGTSGAGARPDSSESCTDAECPTSVEVTQIGVRQGGRVVFYDLPATSDLYLEANERTFIFASAKSSPYVEVTWSNSGGGTAYLVSEFGYQEEVEYAMAEAGYSNFLNMQYFSDDVNYSGHELTINWLTSKNPYIQELRVLEPTSATGTILKNQLSMFANNDVATLLPWDQPATWENHTDLTLILPHYQPRLLADIILQSSSAKLSPVMPTLDISPLKPYDPLAPEDYRYTVTPADAAAPPRDYKLSVQRFVHPVSALSVRSMIGSKWIEPDRVFDRRDLALYSIRLPGATSIDVTVALDPFYSSTPGPVMAISSWWEGKETDKIDLVDWTASTIPIPTDLGPKPTLVVVIKGAPCNATLAPNRHCYPFDGEQYKFEVLPTPLNDAASLSSLTWTPPVIPVVPFNSTCLLGQNGNWTCPPIELEFAHDDFKVPDRWGGEPSLTDLVFEPQSVDVGMDLVFRYWSVEAEDDSDETPTVEVIIRAEDGGGDPLLVPEASIGVGVSRAEIKVISEDKSKTLAWTIKITRQPPPPPPPEESSTGEGGAASSTGAASGWSSTGTTDGSSGSRSSNSSSTGPHSNASGSSSSSTGSGFAKSSTGAHRNDSSSTGTYLPPPPPAPVVVVVVPPQLDPCATAANPCQYGSRCESALTPNSTVAVVAPGTPVSKTMVCRCPPGLWGDACSVGVVSRGLTTRMAGNDSVRIFMLGGGQLLSLTLQDVDLSFERGTVTVADDAEATEAVRGHPSQAVRTLTTIDYVQFTTPSMVQLIAAGQASLAPSANDESVDSDEEPAALSTSPASAFRSASLLEPSSRRSGSDSSSHPSDIGSHHRRLMFAASSSTGVAAPAIPISNPKSTYQRLSFLAQFGGEDGSTIVRQYNATTLLYYTSSVCVERNGPNSWPDGVGGCRSCPTGCDCVGGGRCWPLPGYWSWSERQLPIACTFPESCPGVVANNMLQADGSATIVDTQKCAVGYSGAGCASCAPDFYQLNGRCYACGSSTDQTAQMVTLVMAGVIVALVLSIGVATLHAPGLVILVTLFLAVQQVSVIGAQGARQVPGAAGPALAVFFSYLSATNWDLTILSPSCTVPSFTFLTLFFGTLALVAAMGVLFLAACLVRLWLMRLWGRLGRLSDLTDAERYERTQQALEQAKVDPTLAAMRGDLFLSTPAEDFRRRLTHSLFILCMIFYFKLSTLQLRLFQCVMAPAPADALTADEATPLSLYLKADYQSACYEGTHLLAVIVAALLFAAFTLGFPLGAFVLLCRAFADEHTGGLVGWLRARVALLRPTASKQEQGRRAFERMEKQEHDAQQLAGDGATTAAGVAVAAGRKLARQQSTTVGSSLPPEQQRRLALLYVEHSRIATFGFIFLGVRTETFAFRLVALVSSFYVAAVTTFVLDERHQLFAMGFVFASEALLVTCFLPFTRAWVNLRATIVPLALLAQNTLLLAVQDGGLEAGSPAAYFAVLVCLFSLLCGLLAGRKQIARVFNRYAGVGAAGTTKVQPVLIVAPPRNNFCDIDDGKSVGESSRSSSSSSSSASGGGGGGGGRGGRGSSAARRGPRMSPVSLAWSVASSVVQQGVAADAAAAAAAANESERIEAEELARKQRLLRDKADERAAQQARAVRQASVASPTGAASLSHGVEMAVTDHSGAAAAAEEEELHPASPSGAAPSSPSPSSPPPLSASPVATEVESQQTASTPVVAMAVGVAQANASPDPPSGQASVRTATPPSQRRPSLSPAPLTGPGPAHRPSLTSGAALLGPRGFLAPTESSKLKMNHPLAPSSSSGAALAPIASAAPLGLAGSSPRLSGSVLGQSPGRKQRSSRSGAGASLDLHAKFQRQLQRSSSASASDVDGDGGGSHHDDALPLPRPRASSASPDAGIRVGVAAHSALSPQPRRSSLLQQHRPAARPSGSLTPGSGTAAANATDANAHSRSSSASSRT